MIIGVRTWWAEIDGEAVLMQVPITEREFYVDSLQVTDDASRKVQVAPRISKEFIESQIAREFYFTLDAGVAGGVQALHGLDGVIVDTGHAPDDWQPEYAHHTVCILTTANGFTVVGHSAPASPANFNEALGRRFAYENAFRQLWPLYAFTLLQENMGESVAGDPLNQPPG